MTSSYSDPAVVRAIIAVVRATPCPNPNHADERATHGACDTCDLEDNE